jgi:hypothetical protein
MSVPKMAAALSLVGALSLAPYGPAQSAPLTGLSAAATPDPQQSDAVQVRYGGWGGGWRGGGQGQWLAYRVIEAEQLENRMLAIEDQLKSKEQKRSDAD